MPDPKGEQLTDLTDRKKHPDLRRAISMVILTAEHLQKELHNGLFQQRFQLYWFRDELYKWER